MLQESDLKETNIARMLTEREAEVHIWREGLRHGDPLFNLDGLCGGAIFSSTGALQSADSNGQTSGRYYGREPRVHTSHPFHHP